LKEKITEKLKTDYVERGAWSLMRGLSFCMLFFYVSNGCMDVIITS